MLSPEELKAQNERTLKEAIDAATRGDDLTSEQFNAILDAELEDEDEDAGYDQEDLDEELDEDDVGAVDLKDDADLNENKEEQDVDLGNLDSDNNEVDDFEILGQKYQEKANELNTSQQKLRNFQDHEDRLKNDPIYAKKYFKELGISVQEKDLTVDLEDVDIHGEEYLRNVALSQKKIKLLEEKIDSMASDLEINLQEVKAKEAKNSAMRQIEKLQQEVPELKLKNDFVKSHEAYKNWYDVVGKDNADKYMSDKAFKEAVDKKGYKCPIDMQDYDRISDIYQIFDKYKNGGYSSVRDAYRCSDQFDKIEDNKKSKTLQDGETLIERKLTKVENQTEILDDTTTISDFESGKSVSEAEQIRILDADPRKLNENDRIIRKQLMDKYTQD